MPAWMLFRGIVISGVTRRGRKHPPGLSSQQVQLILQGVDAALQIVQTHAVGAQVEHAPVIWRRAQEADRHPQGLRLGLLFQRVAQRLQLCAWANSPASSASPWPLSLDNRIAKPDARFLERTELVLLICERYRAFLRRQVD